MPREYFDLPSGREKPLKRASKEQQQEYWRLKNAVCAALVRGIRSGKIGTVCPEVTVALEDLAAFAKRHPNRSFKAMRPEDLQTEVTGEDPLCLR